MITPPLPPGAPRAPQPQEDRLVAAVAHLSFLTGFWVVVPIAIYVLKRKESRFVAFHALQAVLVQVFFSAVMTLGVGGFFALVDVAGARRSLGLSKVTLAFSLIGFALGSLAFFAVHAIAAFRAWRGDGWSIPGIGRLAEAILGADKGARRG